MRTAISLTGRFSALILIFATLLLIARIRESVDNSDIPSTLVECHTHFHVPVDVTMKYAYSRDHSMLNDYLVVTQKKQLIFINFKFD